MSVFDGMEPYFFRPNMENTRSMKEEMDGEVFISRQSWHYPFVDNMIKVIFPICTFIWRVNNYVTSQGKVYIAEKEVLLVLYKL